MALKHYRVFNNDSCMHNMDTLKTNCVSSNLFLFRPLPLHYRITGTKHRFCRYCTNIKTNSHYILIAFWTDIDELQINLLFCFQFFFFFFNMLQIYLCGIFCSFYLIACLYLFYMSVIILYHTVNNRALYE